MTRLKNRIAVIIGANGSIGQALVERFVAEGAIVVATGSSQLPQGAGTVHPMLCDLADPDAPASLAEAVASRFGGADILINNAGMTIGTHKVHEISLEGWQRLMDVNLRGVFLGMKAFLPGMLERGAGTIINMGSTSAYRGTPGIAAYCASKAGIIALTQVAALDYADRGIRVNAVCPGTVRGVLLDQQTPERIAMLKARIPMGRFAEPSEVAALAAFLASDDAAYITGQGYLIEGGRFAGG